MEDTTISANLVVDLANTTQSFRSFPTYGAGTGSVLVTSGGAVSSLSGILVGGVWDGINCNTLTNVYVDGRGFGSGPLLIGIQTSDSTASGTFTDPTSGLAALPVNVNSGGFLIIGSGPATDATLGIWSSGQSGSYLLSGFLAFGAFQRPHRYARLFVASGFYDGNLAAGFISQLKVTGSGGGFSYSPGSGVVSV